MSSTQILMSQLNLRSLLRYDRAYLCYDLYIYQWFLDHLSRRLKVSYSDHFLSVVRPCVRPALTFSFKHHLLLNHRTNFIQTSQECSFGGPLSKVFKDFNSIENFGCCGIRKGEKCPNFKNLLL